MRFLVLLVLSLSACGGNYYKETESKAEQVFAGQRVAVLGEASSLTVSSSSISGTGVVRFSDSASSFKSGTGYALDFQLADGASLQLITHADLELNNGYTIEFRRSGSGPGSLQVEVIAQGIRRDTKKSNGTESFGAIDASGPIRLQFDVHNSETPAHVLAWNRDLGDTFTDATAVFNSEENDNSPGIGSGTRWGVRLSGATVTRAELGAVKAGH